MDVHALISEIYYVHEFADKNLIEKVGQIDTSKILHS